MREAVCVDVIVVPSGRRTEIPGVAGVRLLCGVVMWM